MNITEMLGLQDERMESVVKDHWAGWVAFEPRLGVVDDPAGLDAGGRIVFGATVELEDEDSGEQVTYQIVGEDEADLKHGLINVGSPIARALIGKEEGDTAEVQAPGGVRHYEVIAVRYV